MTDQVTESSGWAALAKKYAVSFFGKTFYGQNEAQDYLVRLFRGCAQEVADLQRARIAELEAENAVARRMYSEEIGKGRCSCRFDDNENLLGACLYHKERESRIQELEEELKPYAGIDIEGYASGDVPAIVNVAQVLHARDILNKGKPSE